MAISLGFPLLDVRSGLKDLKDQKSVKNPGGLTIKNWDVHRKMGIWSKHDGWLMASKKILFESVENGED